MKTLRQITISLLLVTIISVGAAAQDPGGSCNPGDTQSPPCSLAQPIASDNETSAAVAATAQVTSTTDVITEVTIDLVETLLSIF